MAKNSKAFSIFPIDLLSIWIVFASLFALLALMLSFFKPWLILGVSSGVLALFIYFMRDRIQWRDARFGLPIWIILGFAFLFRFGPYLYFSAGQDEGLYVLMSNMFEVSGELSYIDEFRTTLNKDVRDFYDKNQNELMNSRIVLQSESRYRFDFYPMNAIWLSLFTKITGPDLRCYSLVFFGLLCLVGVYLIAREWVSPLAGYLAAGLLAINPYHIFFSKFPVSEMTAVGLSTLAFYYLTQMWSQRQRAAMQLFYTVLSVLLFFVFYFARMTGVLYLPLFFSVSCFAMAYDSRDRSIKIWWGYFTGLGIALLVSAYFYFYTYKESLYLTYNDLIFNKLGSYPELKSVFLFIVASSVIYPLSTQIRRFSWQQIVTWVFRSALIGVFAYSCFIMYRLGWGNYYAEHEHITNYKIYLSKSGWRLSTFWPVVTLLCMMSPFAIAAMLWHLFRRDVYGNVPILFFAFFHFLTFWGLIVYHNVFDFYQFYYTRYYVTEVLPAAAILCGSALALLWPIASGRYKYFGRALGVGSIVWGLFYSSFQLGGHEGPRLGFYRSIQNYVNKDDVVVFVDLPTAKEIISPFRYYFNYKKVLMIDSMAEAAKPEFAKFAKLGTRMMVISGNDKLGERDKRFVFIRSFAFEYDYFYNRAIHLYHGSFGGANTVFEGKGLNKFPIPTNNFKKVLPIFLYQIAEQ